MTRLVTRIRRRRTRLGHWADEKQWKASECWLLKASEPGGGGVIRLFHSSRLWLFKFHSYQPTNQSSRHFTAKMDHNMKRSLCWQLLMMMMLNYVRILHWASCRSCHSWIYSLHIPINYLLNLFLLAMWWVTTACRGQTWTRSTLTSEQLIKRQAQDALCCLCTSLAWRSGKPPLHCASQLK